MSSKYWMNKAPKCPYCDHEHLDWYDMNIGRYDGDDTEQECYSCGKKYEATLHIEYSFTTIGLPCDVHQLFMAHEHVKQYGCSVCKREFYDWQLDGGRHQKLTKDQYVITSEVEQDLF